MSEFSMEKFAERIYNPNSRKYFQEVISSYINGNNRSAVVMLWTVCVADIVFKLYDLKDIYNDVKANNILSEITAEQAKNSKSPEWERRLLDKLVENKYIEQYEYIALQNIHQNRHLSAHPIIKDDMELFQPDQDHVRSLIRHSLEYLLVKPIFFDSKTLQVIITDLSNPRFSVLNDKELEKYLRTKFYTNMTNATIKKIFKDLWKFVFYLESPEADANREINAKALVILYNYKKELLRAYMKTERGFCHINNKYLRYYLLLCNRQPDFFDNLNKDTFEHLLTIIKSDSQLSLLSYVIHDSINDFLIHISNNMNDFRFSITNEERVLILDKALHYAKEQDYLDILLDNFVKIYCESNEYAKATQYFQIFIMSYLHEMSRLHLERIVEAFENNPQIYERYENYYGYSLSSEKTKIRNRCDELNIDYQ